MMINEKDASGHALNRHALDGKIPAAVTADSVNGKGKGRVWLVGLDDKTALSPLPDPTPSRRLASPPARRNVSATARLSASTDLL